MFIQTENTPNPNTLKFIPGQYITGGEPVNFTSREDASNSPFAVEIFSIEKVTAVFLGFDFITVTKEADASWDILKPYLLTSIMDYLVSGKDIFIDSNHRTAVINEDDSDLVKQIKELIETRVRPAVAQDGGDIIFKEFTDGIVKLELHGACSGCPSSTVTLKDGIENMLKYYVPEIIAVESV